jgi:hypothetical protein
MLSQQEANQLISSLKQLLVKKNLISFPNPDEKMVLECKDGNNNNYIINAARGRQK